MGRFRRLVCERHNPGNHCKREGDDEKLAMADEIFDVVNERDEVIGRAPRKDVHARGLWHRAAHVLVFNARGEVFLQKRSMKKDTAPGAWDSSSSGHLGAGEDYDETAWRELGEEIGWRPATVPRRLFKIAACDETGWEFVWVYATEGEGPFELNADEVERGEWFAPEEIDRRIAARPRGFARAFVYLWPRVRTMISPVRSK